MTLDDRPTESVPAGFSRGIIGLAVLGGLVVLWLVAVGLGLMPGRARGEDSHVQRAREAWEDEDWATVITESDLALAVDPDSADALVLRGSAFFWQGAIERAQQDLDRAVALAPDLAVAHFHRGLVLWNLGELDAAIEEVERAIALDPDDFEAHHALLALQGNQAEEALDHETARACYEGIPSESFLYGYACLHLGFVQFDQADFEGARKSFERAQDAGEDPALAGLGRAVALQQLRRMEESLAVLQELPADDPRVLGALVQVHQDLGDHEAALRACERLVALDPGDGQSLLYRAEVLRRLGRAEEAERDLERAMKVPGQAATALMLLGFLRIDQGDAEGARAAFEASRQRDPEQGWVQVGLGLLEHELRNWERSTDHLNEALRLGTDDEDYVQLLLWANGTLRGERASADEQLGRYLEGKENPPLWLTGLVPFLTGETAEEPDLDVLDPVPVESLRSERSGCLYAIGVRHAADGNTSAARDALERCLAIPASRNRQLACARARLADLSR